MPAKKEETASFVLRFNQKIFQTEEGEPQVQWRGNIRHVQGDEEKHFSDFEEVIEFIKSKLTDLTHLAIEDKTPEEQKGILSKSFELWKKMAFETPKMVFETIKDPKKMAQMQAQVQNQINQVSDAITQKIEDTVGQKLEIDDFRPGSKSDYKNLVGLLEKMSIEIEQLNRKVDKLDAKGKKKE